MHSTLTARNDKTAREVVEALERIIDRLADAPALADELDAVRHQAWKLALAAERQAPARSLDDGGPDYEDSAEWPADPSEWPEWTDDVWTITPDADGPTPDAVLALELPALCGGSPEAEPGADAWDEYRTWCDNLEAIHDGIEFAGRLTEQDVITATGAC